MTLVLQRPWSMSTYNPFNGITANSGGTRNDTQLDSRAAMTKTPRGKWRPPTPYFRTIETGFLYCYNLQASDDFHYAGQPPWVRGFANFAGAQNASGYYYVPIPDIPSNLEQKAILKARLKLKNMKVNLSQNLGERKQTERLVVDTLSRLRTMVLDVRRLKPKPEDAFNLWLEIQYGWKPLLSDCHGAVSALHQREQELLSEITTVKAVAMDHDRTDTLVNDIYSSNPYTLVRTRRISHKVMVRLDFVEDDNPVVNRSLVELGITNPLELAWELLPFSFVADWFIPIGDYLSQLDATLGYTFKGGSCSRVTRVEVHPTSPQWAPDSNIGKDDRRSSLSVNGYGSQVAMDRKVYASAPMAIIPNVGKLTKNSGMHVSNGIALLGSAIAGNLRVR